MRKIHDLQQGTNSWHAFRAEHFGASEASAVFGLSPYKTRTQLLNEKKTGLVPDVDAFTQKVFDKGHAVEALARPIVENIIGEELSPVTYSFGKLSASCDGLSFMGDIAWENKQFNAAHYEQVKNGELPEIHWPQCQQVLHCTGAEKLFFTISDGTEERTAGVWVYPNEDQQNQIIAVWAQFESDLANHVPAVVKEKVVAEEIQSFPVPSIQVRGELVDCNLSKITPVFDKYIAETNTVLVTDQDFADGEANAKNCRDAAKNLKLTAKAVIGQITEINEAVSTLELYANKFDALGLKLEKAVKEQKESIKTNAILKAKQDFFAHIQELEAEVKPIRLVVETPNFAEAIKGLKTIDSMHAKISQALINGYLNADSIARDIRSKQVWLKESADGYQMLFADIQTIIHKPMDDLQVLVKSRIAEHKQKEIEREAAIKAQAELEAKANAEREAKIIADANAMALEQERLSALKKEHASELKQEPLGALDMSSGVGRLGTGISPINPVVVGNPTPVQQEQIKQAIQHFQGVEPSVNDLVNAVAKQFGADVMMAHRWLINADFSKYQQAA